MKNENESGKLHPFDSENFATAAAKAHESGLWMAALFYIEDDKVSSHLTTNEFPQADFDLAKKLFGDNIKQVYAYKINTAMPDLANLQQPDTDGNPRPDLANFQQPDLAEVEEEAADDAEDEDKMVADEFGFPSDAMRLMRKK